MRRIPVLSTPSTNPQTEVTVAQQLLADAVNSSDEDNYMHLVLRTYFEPDFTPEDSETSSFSDRAKYPPNRQLVRLSSEEAVNVYTRVQEQKATNRL